MGDGSSNELLSVEASDDGIFLRVMGMANPGQSKSRLTFEGGAKRF